MKNEKSHNYLRLKIRQSRFNKFDLNSAAKRIEREMKKMEIKIVKSRKSATVVGREGPLEEGVEKAFKQIGSEIVELIP